MLSPQFKKELKITLKLAIPIIIAQMGVVLMGVSDNIMVGKFLGKTALGAAGIGNSIAFLISSLAIGGFSVVAPMVSKTFAEKSNIRNLYRSGLWVAVGYSIALTLIGILAYFSFHFLNQKPQIEKLAKPYFLIILISNIPLYFFLMAKQLTDGLSLPKISMYITLFGLVFNVLFNYLFINGIGIFPNLGLQGAGLSTVLTRIITLVVLIIYIKNNAKLNTALEGINIPFYNKETIKKIYNLSIPGGFQIFFEIGAFTFAVIMMGWISETDLAAHNIAINIAGSTYMMATGISFAGAIRVGDAWGSKSVRRIKSAGHASLLLISLFMIAAMFLIINFDEQIVGLYIDDEQVKAVAVKLLLIAAFFQFSDGIQSASLGALRGLADVKLPTIITFIAYWLIALPLGYLLAFKANLGSSGIWIGLLLGLTFAAIFLVYRFQFLIRPKEIRKRLIG